MRVMRHSWRLLLGGLLLLSAIPLSGCVYFPNPPVFGGDFPDPAVEKTQNQNFRAYATNTGGANIPHASAPALGGPWTGHPDALPNAAGAWAFTNDGHVWAPDVKRFPDQWVMYYTARSQAWPFFFQCIGGAISTSGPAGPFTPYGFGPLVCQLDKGGSIDPYLFKNPQTGNFHLLWKNDGIAASQVTHLWSVRMSDDGLLPVGQVKDLLVANQPWEIGFENLANIENPAMEFRQGNGTFYLYYSAARWCDPSYAVGYAYNTQGPGGAFIKGDSGTGGPILASGGAGLGPGGDHVVKDEQGRPWMAYHAFQPDAAADCEVFDARFLRFSRLTIDAQGRPELGHSP